MTGTSFEIVRGDGFSDYIPNKVLGEVLMKNFQEAGAPDFDREDHELAKNIQNTFSDQIMREQPQRWKASMVKMQQQQWRGKCWQMWSSP